MLLCVCWVCTSSDVYEYPADTNRTLIEKSTFLILLISVLGVFQRVPLGDRAPGGRQHVAPMSQFCAARVLSQNHLADWFRRTDAIVIHYGDDELHFLKKPMKSQILAI